MREVERLTIYEPPLRQAERGESPDTGDHPVNLLFVVTPQTEALVIARTVYAGADFSQRSGNYFVHALVGDAQTATRLPVLPIELWDAPFWVTRQGQETVLPLLPDSLPTGPLTAGSLARQRDADHEGALAQLLVAVAGAVAGGQQVVLVDVSTTAVCRWIAAACHLLGPGLGPKVTFATYSHDPRRCATHVVGMVESAGLFQGSMTAHTRQFDFTKGIIPDLSPWPSARLLARIGVARSGPLWELATTLSPAAADSPETALPVLASAALLQEHQLTTAELEAAISWLASPPAPQAAGHCETAVRSALRHPVEELAVDRQADLVELALRADPGSAIAGHHLAGQVESTLATRMLDRLSHGERPHDVIVLRTDRARKQAAEVCTAWLPRLNAAQVLDLLAWASSAGVQPAEDVVRSTGRSTILALLLDGQAPGNLNQVAGDWPSLRHGLVDGIAGMPAGARRSVLAGPGADIFRDKDFAGHANLHEGWLILSAGQGRIGKADACGRLIKLRHGQGHIPALDRQLLENLWPAGGWTLAEAREMVARIPPAELANEMVTRQLMRLIYGASDYGSVEWMRFIVEVSEVPERILPDQETAVVLDLASAITSVGQASGDSRALGFLIVSYDSRRPEAREFLDAQLPPLILRRYVRSLNVWEPVLGYVFSDCPAALYLNICEYVRALLEKEPRDMRLPAWIYVTMRQLESEQKYDHAYFLNSLAMQPARQQWSRQESSLMAKYVKQFLPRGGNAVDLWLAGKQKTRFLGRLRNREPED